VVHVARTRNAYKILVRKHEGISGHRWEDNIIINLKEIVLEGMDWICVAQDRYQFRLI